MNQQFTKDEYSKFVDKKSPNSHLAKDMAWAFIVGGIICTIGQGIMNFFTARGLPKETVSSITSILLILIAVILTALDLYDSIGKRAGAGSVVPITGFANSIASPAIEYKTEGYVMGLGAKMFTVAGPVLVYGISASIVVGFIYFLMH
ncbi:MAG: stage V sporulation protein AC [Clostridia bacterium]|nr:stage V sporulation protein AC [Clostridia bacterium]